MKHLYLSRLIPFLTSRFKVRVLPFTTETLSSSSFDSLYERIQIIRDPKASIVPVLDKWIDEGRTVKRQELQLLVRRMKDYRRFHHALEVSQWMSDRRYFCLSSSDCAVRLDLIVRVHGLEHAEKYFENISNKLKTFNTYGALLNCYVREESVEKAESLMQKMKEMGFTVSSFPYNVLMNLYSKSGQHGKIDILMQEMERNGIPHDMFTFNSRLAAYVAASDITGMENILNQMEKDPRIVVDWRVYSIAASGYVEYRMTDKALMMLKKVEGLAINTRNKLAFEHLLTLYTRLGLKEEVYRIWNLFKSSGKIRYSSYGIMISSLAKLDDIDGAEKIFEEWESSRSRYDYRVLNQLLVAYCRKGFVDKAELVAKKAAEKRTPYSSTWNILAFGYLEDKQMPKVVDMFKKAMLVGRKGYKPSSIILDACLEFMEGQGDAEGMQDIIMLYRTQSRLTIDIYHRLLRICIAARKPVLEVLVQMKVDGFFANEETQKIVETGPADL